MRYTCAFIKTKIIPIINNLILLFPNGPS